jgi:hypothetical protein
MPPVRWSGLLRILYVYPVGILDVQTSIVALQRIGAALRQIARGGFPAESRNPDGKVVDDVRGASMVERDEHLGVAEADYAARLILTDHRETEHLLIEID